MPDHKTQCDSCAFRLVEDQSTLESDVAIENKYKVLRALSGAPKKPRIVDVGGNDNKTQTCFVNSPLWPTKVKDTYCPDRIDDFLSLETALRIRIASKANLASELQAAAAFEQARWAKWAAIIATVAANCNHRSNEMIVRIHP